MSRRRYQTFSTPTLPLITPGRAERVPVSGICLPVRSEHLARSLTSLDHMLPRVRLLLAPSDLW